MKRQRILIGTLVLVLLLALSVGLTQAQGPEPQGGVGPLAAVGTAFTYQGRLNDGGSPANGTYDFEFKLYDDASGGSQVGSTATEDDITMTDGLFTVELDFGSSAFTGDARWLEIGVRPGSSTGAYTTLTPRQALTAVPYALYALSVPWDGLTGVPPGFADDVDNDTTYSAGDGLTLNGTIFSADTTYLQRRVSGSCAADNAIRVIYADGAVECQSVAGGEGGWSLTGNAGTTPDPNFLGTTDNQALELRVNSARALRLEPNSTSPNVIGGYSGNSVTSGAVGATIGGGGASTGVNQVTSAGADYATVSGGRDNSANGEYSTVSGGGTNTASNNHATVSGGGANTAGGEHATIGGGLWNTTSTNGGTIAGGRSNSTSGGYATVPGGRNNAAAGDYSFAAGYRAKANNQGCFVWGDSTNADVNCNDNNRFVVRASGGVYMYTNSSLTSGAYLAAGASAWSMVSDRNLKENFMPVDGQEVLARLAEIPITTWNYKSQAPGIRHIGPMAQDFAVFGLGEDDKHISTVDADGVALAAIQGLYQIVQEQEARIEALEAENTALQGQLDSLTARVAALEGQPGGER